MIEKRLIVFELDRLWLKCVGSQSTRNELDLIGYSKLSLLLGEFSSFLAVEDCLFSVNFRSVDLLLPFLLNSFSGLIIFLSFVAR